MLSGRNIIGLPSSTLTECEIINLNSIKSMCMRFKEYFDNNDNIKWNFYD